MDYLSCERRTKYMKTSTKNTIIAGGFTIAASIIGLVSFCAGENEQSSKVNTTIGQSGIITINQMEIRQIL